MSNKISVVQEFAAKWRSHLPAADKPGVFRPLEFTAQFRLFPQTESMQTQLRRIQDDRGNHGFLDHVMTRVVDMPAGFEFEDADSNPMSAEDGVKQHLIIGADAVLAFWDVVNKGVEEKNLKASRAR